MWLQMLSEQFIFGKNFAARRTRMLLVINAMRTEFVPFQINFVGERSLALVHIAFVWLFAGMSSGMCFYFHPSCEYLRAKLTFMRFSACVRIHMISQMIRLWISTPTNIAHILPSRMDVHVLPQIAITRKCSTANCTNWFFSYTVFIGRYRFRWNNFMDNFHVVFEWYT